MGDLARTARAQAASARGVAAGRVAVGLALFVRPTLLPVALGTPPEQAAPLTWVLQMFAAREVALGVITLTTGRGVLAGAFADAVDAAAVAAAVRRGRVDTFLGSGAVVVAAAAAALGVRDGLTTRL